jgi:hypothetical protein
MSSIRQVSPGNNPPHTPRKPHVSPYFTSVPKQFYDRDHLASPHNVQCTGGEPHADISLPTSEGDRDPLLRFYRRSFTRLYARMQTAKPVLIQGSLCCHFILAPMLNKDPERVADDPWRVLVAVTLLNTTSGKLAIPVFWEIMSRYPDALSLSQGHSFPHSQC